MKECELSGCSNVFDETKHQNKKPQRFCSRKCANKYIAKNKSFNKVCIVCSKQYPAKAPNQKICSRECFIEHRKARKKITQKINEKEWICKYCNNSFFRDRKRNGFCSRSCASKYYIEEGISPKVQDNSPPFIRTSKPQIRLWEYVKEKYKNHNFESEKRINFEDGTHCYVDIVSFSRKVIVEYYGDFWHANPKKYNSDTIHPKINKKSKEIWARDEQRNKKLIDLGYNVIIVWGSDFIKSDSYQTILENNIAL